MTPELGTLYQGPPETEAKDRHIMISSVETRARDTI